MSNVHYLNARPISRQGPHAVDMAQDDFVMASAHRFENGSYLAQEDAAVLRLIANTIIHAVKNGQHLYSKLDVAAMTRDGHRVQKGRFYPLAQARIMAESYEHLLDPDAMRLLNAMVERAFA